MTLDCTCNRLTEAEAKAAKWDGIVRCRECAEETRYPDGQIDHYCDLIGTWAETEWNPDGFCAWGKRREDA